MTVALFCCLPAVKESGKQAGITLSIFSPVCPTRYQKAGKRLVFVNLVHYRSDSLPESGEKDVFVNLVHYRSDSLPESGKKTDISPYGSDSV